MSGQAKPPSRFTRVFASTFRIVRTDAAFACPGRPGLFAAGDVRTGANTSLTPRR